MLLQAQQVGKPQNYSKENMKRHLFTILVLLSMLVMPVGVAAAPMASGTATLVGVQYVPGKGPVFIFSVSGKFSKAELKGSLHVEGGADYNLHCTQVEESMVKCNTSSKVADVNAAFSWGGSTFWAYVPAAPVFCYDVYDYNLSLTWQSYGTHCQDDRAQYGDEIPWYNPDWYDDYDAVFLPEGPSCSGIYEDAYYYPFCT